MDEKEKIKQEVQEELKWVKYRLKILDIIDDKLIEMRKMAERARDEELTPVELEELNFKINNLAQQIVALDSESKKIEDEKILNGH